MMDNLLTFPKVLIISHNALSSTNNMGKTLESYFKKFPKSCLAQLYFHEGTPDSDICDRFYSFSDRDALYSIFNRSFRGVAYNGGKCKVTFCKQASKSEVYYSVGKKRKPAVMLARDFIWKISNVRNKRLISWVNEFDPDIIFFASGDYSFSYKMALFLSKKISKPLAICCFDDFYLYCNYKKQFCGKIYYHHFMKVVRKAFEYSNCLFATNELMAQEYATFFKRNFSILYTAADFEEKVKYEDKKGICYLGGLNLNRYETIIQIGMMLRKYFSNDENLNHINVYSNEQSPEILKEMTISNGIVFRGYVDAVQTKKIIAHSLAVVHVESFDQNFRQRTKLSLSTKIAESLASGTVLIALGPQEIASMQYLKKYNAAILSDNIEDLKNKLFRDLLNKNQYMQIVSNALNLAKQNHNADRINKVIVNELKNAIHSYNKGVLN